MEAPLQVEGRHGGTAVGHGIVTRGGSMHPERRMQLDEQQESMLDLSAGEGPPAMAGAPLRVSFEDPRPGGQKIEKVRLLGLTGVMVGLIVFGIGWRSFRSARNAGPAEAPVAADAGKATGADAASVQPEPVVEAGAPDPELSAHDGGTAP